MSRVTLIGSKCDDRSKDCSLRMGTRAMVGMSFFMTGLCSSCFPCMRQKGLDVFRLINGKARVFLTLVLS